MKHTRWGDLLLILLSAALSLFWGIVLFFLPKKSFSEVENRALTELSVPRLDSFLTGSFSEELSRFCRDQFPLRSELVRLSAYAELLLGKGERGGILFGKQGYLIPRREESDPLILSKNTESLSALALRSATPVSVLLVPRHEDVLTNLLPNGYQADRSASPMTDLDASILYPLAEWEGKAEYYYKTDHHWTTDGAYEAYRTLGERLGYVPWDPSDFQRITVSEEFLGSSHSNTGGVSFSADSLILYRYGDDERFLVRYEGEAEAQNGFYRLEWLEKKDKYSLFLGGNFSRLTVTDPTAEGKPRLLLIKDSFANALIPFLAIHFDLTVIDPRYRVEALEEDLSEYDQILILQGIDTLEKDPSLSRFLARLS